MNSDEDELANYDATTTPYRVEKYVDTNAKNTKPNGRAAVAGPSSKPASKARGNTRKRSPSPQDGDDDANDSEEATGQPAPAPRKGRSKRDASREPEQAPPAKVKSVPHGKGKGKGKAAKARDPSPEVMDIDNLDEIRADAEDEVEIAPRQRAQAWNLKRNQQSNGSASWEKREEKFQRELERLNKQFQDAKNQRDNFARQLEEVFLLRNTEAETNASHQATLYESRLQTQEEMIQELTSQLARVDSLTKEGKMSTLHFLTREAADEERKGVERQVTKLKHALGEKDKVIAERDATISNQAAEIRDLQRELSAEIERSKSLTSSRPIANGRDALARSRIASGPNSGVKLEGVKATQTHRLYEDLTNILIIDCRCEVSGEANEEQWVYSCLYTHSGGDWSLAFSLRSYNEADENGNSLEKVAYTPKEMSDKSPESLEKLDFLADEFTFHRKQLDVFLDKLYNSMNDAFGPGEGDE